MSNTPEAVLSYWFPEGFDEADPETRRRQARRWMAGGSEVDREITERFGETLEKARRGENTRRNCYCCCFANKGPAERSALRNRIETKRTRNNSSTQQTLKNSLALVGFCKQLLDRAADLQANQPTTASI